MAENDYRAAVSSHPDGALIDLWVVPGASRSEVVGMHGECVKVRVAAAAESGKANEAAAKLLQGTLGVASVEIVSGYSSRRKRFLAKGISVPEALSRLGG